MKARTGFCLGNGKKQPTQQTQCGSQSHRHIFPTGKRRWNEARTPNLCWERNSLDRVGRRVQREWEGQHHIHMQGRYNKKKMERSIHSRPHHHHHQLRSSVVPVVGHRHRLLLLMMALGSSINERGTGNKREASKREGGN